MARSDLVLCLLALLAVLPLAAAARAMNMTTHLHFFLHDTVHGPNATAVRVAPSAAPSMDLHFGDVYVIDDPLTAGPALSSTPVGRAQGTYVVASRDPDDVALAVTANLVFTAGTHNGSTLAVVSRLSLAAAVAELAVVGGSGWFRGASGYAMVAASPSNDTTTIFEWDVYVTK